MVAAGITASVVVATAAACAAYHICQIVLRSASLVRVRIRRACSTARRLYPKSVEVCVKRGVYRRTHLPKYGYSGTRARHGA